MIKRLFKFLIGKSEKINYDDLIYKVIDDPSTYIRNLSVTSFSYIFEIETYHDCLISKCKTYNVVIDKLMPSYTNIMSDGKIAHTFGINETQLLLISLKKFIN